MSEVAFHSSEVQINKIGVISKLRGIACRALLPFGFVGAGAGVTYELATPDTAIAMADPGYPYNQSGFVDLSSMLGAYSWGYETCLSGMNCAKTVTMNGKTYYYRDSKGYDAKNCTSYAAWRVKREFGKDIDYWGNADVWDTAAHNAGYKVSGIDADKTGPEPGDIAQWDSMHVAIVESVNPDGSTNVSQYNRGGNGEFSYETNRRANHYIDINGIGNGLQGGSNPTPMSGSETISYASIADGQEFYSQEGHVYTNVGGAAFHIKHRNNWNSGDTVNWGNAPVGPVPTSQVHDHEAGVSASGQRQVGAHPPRAGTAVYIQDNSQQWFFINGGGAYPIGPGEIDDLGVRDKALMIPNSGRLDDFKNRDVPLQNRIRYRFAGTAAVKLLALQPDSRYFSYRVPSDTMLSCLELTEGGSTQVLPQSALPYLEGRSEVVPLTSSAACQFPSHFVLRGPGGQEQWHIEGNGSSAGYTRHYYSSQLGLELYTSGQPDYRVLRSVDAINGVQRGPDMAIQTNKPFRGQSSNQVFYYENGQLRLVPDPATLSCLGNPSVTVVGDSSISGMPQGPWKTCNFEGKIIYRPDGRQYHILNGKKMPIGTTAISACIRTRRGTGEPIAVSNGQVDSYVDGDRIAWCNYEGEPGLNFVREDGDPTVKLVRANGIYQHVGSLCVNDPYTTPLKKFRVHIVPRGETAGHVKSGDWFASGEACAALPG